MSKISKTTANRGSITRTVDSTAQTNADEAGARLEPVLFPNGVPDPLTVADVMVALSGLVRRRWGALEAADIAVAGEKNDDEQLRDLRDEQVPNTREKFMATRSIVDAHWGPEGVRAAGLAGQTPEVPGDLVHHGRNVEAKLTERLRGRSSRLNIPAPDLDKLAADLGDDVSELELLLESLDIDIRETQNAQNERIQATEGWDNAYSPVAAILENLFRLAGMDAQAERVRPTNRRRAGRLEPEDLEDDRQENADEATNDDVVPVAD